MTDNFADIGDFHVIAGIFYFPSEGRHAEGFFAL
jgi:hypothetical protein